MVTTDKPNFETDRISLTPGKLAISNSTGYVIKLLNILRGEIPGCSNDLYLVIGNVRNSTNGYSGQGVDPETYNKCNKQ